MKKKIMCLLLVFTMVLTAAGCDSDNPKEGEYQVYYLNREITKVVPEAYDSTGVTGEELAWELIEQLRSVPDSSKLQQTIPSNVAVKSIKSDGSYLTVDFGEAYKEMSVAEEVLIRAAIVRTLLQIPEYSLVAFTVNAEPLRTSDGTLVGNMTTDNFVENPGAQINASIESTIKLYFSSEDGTGLIEETRVVTHSSSISMEKLIMEQLIDGPSKSKARATIPAATKLVNVSVADGICYVSLDDSFQNQDQEIKEEIVLYSIVNSLTELPGVTKVQLSINGDTKGFCRYTYELSKIYEKNLSLLESNKTEGK